MGGKTGGEITKNITELITEAEFLRNIIKLAHTFHWRAHHTRVAWSEKGWRTPVQGDKGFLDLVLVRRPRLIIAELKSEKGRLSREQREWLLSLKGCVGVEIYVWKPSMWEDICGILR